MIPAIFYYRSGVGERYARFSALIMFIVAMGFAAGRFFSDHLGGDRPSVRYDKSTLPS